MPQMSQVRLKLWANAAETLSPCTWGTRSIKTGTKRQSASLAWLLKTDNMIYFVFWQLNPSKVAEILPKLGIINDDDLKYYTQKQTVNIINMSNAN